MAKEKKALGRPTKFKPEYCEMLVEHMASGMSFESFAGIIDVNQDTLHEWVKHHVDFSEAKKRAWAKNRVFWEKVGIDGLYNESYRDKDSSHSKQLNAAIWVFNMKNRFKWRDRIDVIEKPAKPINRGFKTVEQIPEVVEEDEPTEE